ncbi:MAG TPA: tetratricopeptide repeat protein [Haliscomenobacter sp.]|mgnify:CR=1 FL=1|uniref:tetratricopeptide repeat protein n=1 Tax=Haliscomenobacter sp. TaxID=2717303 RepID=UPI002CAF417D|nr:tetratricopeptide repeat protein [Haliscomenobacter sp.]HOY19462.1 tetratricopeptide repeat protein [Haliscomenobacter sp.]
MKSLSSLFLVLLGFIPVLAQTEGTNTTGDNSPSVIAKSFSATYGVRADAVEAILWIYEAEGYDVARRKRAIEQILREYAQSPEKQQKADILSEASRRKIGITDAPKVANALEWDLFARSHYLSTTGYNSPAVMAKGDVNIWYGIPPKALRALALQLEKNKTDLSNFETKLSDQVKKYEELKTELETYGGKEEIYRKAEVLLAEGKLEEAEQLIETDYRASKKRQAYKGYVFGKAKELLQKYDEAAEGYRDAVFMDNSNSTYHLHYGYNEEVLAHYDEAIKHYEIALSIDSLKSGNESRTATLMTNLGTARESKGEYNKAIEYFEKALQIFLKTFGENHPNVATNYNNLGAAWESKGEYSKAIEYYEKALQINVKASGENHPDLAINYNNLAGAWATKGEYDKAIEYFEKALQIFLKAFGENHPNVATNHNNLGAVWTLKGRYDKAIDYYDKALQTHVKALGEDHPDVARDYNNLGLVWTSKGEYDKAIGYFEKALKIGVKALGEDHPDVARDYNNLGGAWFSKKEYDKCIGYFEKALKIDVKALGEDHPNVAREYTNLGGAWKEKEEYDKCIEYFEKALQIFLKAFGENHPDVAKNYNNLGGAWSSKREYDKAIRYYEKALQIDLKALGEDHPNVATRYHNLGKVWSLKGEYDKAIGYYEKCQAIFDPFLPLTHPNQRITAQNLSSAANYRGMQLFSEKNYQEALTYFQKAFKNAQKASDDAFSLTCLNNMGSMQKHLKQYAEGLQSLDTGLQKAAEMKDLAIMRRMQYHKVGCLKGLNRNKEADALAKQLWQEGIESNDTRLLEDLRKEGYDFGR